jgi:hypothetical protein
VSALLAILLAIVTSSANIEAPSGLVIRTGVIDAAMGLRAMTITMVNKDTQPHTFNGYPAVRVLDKYREPLPVKIDPGATEVTTGFDTPATPITIEPGKTATAVLTWRNTVTDSNVNATNGAYLDLAPTTGAPWQTRYPKGGIDLGNTGKLGVSAWTTP